MTSRLTRAGAAALAAAVSAAAALALGVGGAPAAAHDYTLGDLTLEHPWIRPPRGGRDVTAGYVHVVNAGAADRLIAASSPLAEAVELHTHIDEDGVMRMRPVEAIAAPAGGSVTLAPGGDHIMLFGLADGVTEGAVVPVTLTFETAGPVTVDFHVEATPSESPGGADGAHNHH